MISRKIRLLKLSNWLIKDKKIKYSGHIYIINFVYMFFFQETF